MYNGSLIFGQPPGPGTGVQPNPNPLIKPSALHPLMGELDASQAQQGLQHLYPNADPLALQQMQQAQEIRREKERGEALDAPFQPPKMQKGVPRQ